MRTYFYHNPRWFQNLYSNVIWTVNDDRNIYLTFDDGPCEKSTVELISILKEYGAKATFFVKGKNVLGNQQLLHLIKSNGHEIANHGMNHLNGFFLTKQELLREIHSTKEILREFDVLPLYRPPYGNIWPWHVRSVISQGSQVVLWSHLSADFQPKLNYEKTLNLLVKAKAGSILLFHDTSGSVKHLRIILPKILNHFLAKGYSFKTLKQICN